MIFIMNALAGGAQSARHISRRGRTAAAIDRRQARIDRVTRRHIELAETFLLEDLQDQFSLRLARQSTILLEKNCILRACRRGAQALLNDASAENSEIYYEKPIFSLSSDIARRKFCAKMLPSR